MGEMATITLLALCVGDVVLAQGRLVQVIKLLLAFALLRILRGKFSGCDLLVLRLELRCYHLNRMLQQSGEISMMHKLDKAMVESELAPLTSGPCAIMARPLNHPEIILVEI